MLTNRTSLALSTLLALVLALGTAAPAQAQFGVAGGLNFESTDDIQATDGQATLDNSTGYHVGLVYELGLGPLNIRPGVFYRRVGDFQISGVTQQLSDARYTVSAWEVPVDLRLSVLSLPLFSPYILAGPKATFLRGEAEFDDAVEDISYVLNVGLGAQISLPGSSLRLQPELRYEFGATGFIDDEAEVGLGDQDVTFSPQESPNFSTFALRLHVLF